MIDLLLPQSIIIGYKQLCEARQTNKTEAAASISEGGCLLKEQHFTAKQVADILGMPKSFLLEKERNGALPLARRDPATKHRYYLTEDLPAVRKALGLPPILEGHRTQLLLNFKGGTGKSSIAASYAFHLAELGLKVLAVDLDAQAHMTKCLGYEGSNFKFTLYNVLIEKLPLHEAIVSTKLKNLKFIPANLGLSPVELSLTAMTAREHRLRKTLDAVRNEYDIIVMDAPPNIGLLNLNAILAANDLIIPVLADFLSYEALRILFETIASIEEDFSYVLDRIAIVLNRYNKSMNICRTALKALEKHYTPYLLKTVIRQCTKFADASSIGVPITQYAPSSKGAVDLSNLVKEIFGLGQRPKTETREQKLETVGA